MQVEREDYEGMVYNLVLGTPEERATLGQAETTMYAGGMLVGDAQMQTLIKQNADAAALAGRMDRLPEALRHDHALAAARQKLRDSARASR